MTARPSAVVMALTSAGATPSASFARPADTTQYAAGDLVANSATAGAVVPLQFIAGRTPGAGVRVLAARLAKSGTGIGGANFRLHLFTAAPTVANGDNGVLSMTGLAGYLGALDITCDRAFADGAFGRGVPLTGPCIVAEPAEAERRLFGLLEARGSYTPGNAEAFTLTLELDRD